MDKNKMSASLSENMGYLNSYLAADTNFDLIYRVIKIGGMKPACIL